MKSFSPINTKKGYGIRFNVGAADKSKTSFNLDAQNIFSQAMMDENEDAEQDAIVEQEEEEKPLQRFGDYENQEEKVFEGQCYLKTKTDRYKEHWAVLAGNELYCYR